MTSLGPKGLQDIYLGTKTEGGVSLQLLMFQNRDLKRMNKKCANVFSPGIKPGTLSVLH